MKSQLVWFIRLLTRKLWFRATLIALLAVASPLVAAWIGPLIPFELYGQIGADAVENILDIIASSMLAVTTFSLTTMVSAYAAATTSVTPRATKLMIEDPTSQNVLATFLGSFLFSLVAIITLSMELYDERGRVVLFAFTIFVAILIVAMLLRWIDYVLRLGRVNETAAVIENATLRAVEAERAMPNLGGRALRANAAALPRGWAPIHAEGFGYVRNVDMRSISEWAETTQTDVRLAALPGSFVDPGRPLAFVRGEATGEGQAVVRQAFAVDRERTFDGDPRFGFAVLTEIASRALSPAINDPGTAIDVIGRASRLLAEWCREGEEGETVFPRIEVPVVTTSSLFDTAFTPIARDGAAMVEVHVRLQRAFEALARIETRDCAAEALRHSRQSLERAAKAMTSSDDLKRVKEAAAHVGKR